MMPGAYGGNFGAAGYGMAGRPGAGMYGGMQAPGAGYRGPMQGAGMAMGYHGPMLKQQILKAKLKTTNTNTKSETTGSTGSALSNSISGSPKGETTNINKAVKKLNRINFGTAGYGQMGMHGAGYGQMGMHGMHGMHGQMGMHGMHGNTYAQYGYGYDQYGYYHYSFGQIITYVLLGLTPFLLCCAFCAGKHYATQKQSNLQQPLAFDQMSNIQSMDPRRSQSRASRF